MPYRHTLCFAWFITLLAAHASAAERSIYRCVEAGVATYSDRPCGASVEVYSYDVPAPAVPDPPAAAKPRSKPASAVARQPAKVRSEQRGPARTADCARIQVQLKQLRARMRAGYGAAEGEYLQDQQRAARARARQLRCR